MSTSLSPGNSFGEYYGYNLDALWDRLSTDIERPVAVIWEDASLSRARLGAELFDTIIGVLRRVEGTDAKSNRADRFTVEIRE